MKVPAYLVAALSLGGVLFAGIDPGFDPASASADEHREIIDRYLTATQNNKSPGLQMDAQISASLPKLQKNGSLEALRTISKFGKITWDRLHFSGDSTIKKEVIARFIQGEQDHTDTSAIAITPENYKFKYKGLENRLGQQVYVFHVTPRKKLLNLFKGEIWLDAQTCLPVHESGIFVKSPSLFLKRVQFVRDYQVVNGYSVPKQVESQAETRFWGPATVTIHYNNFVKAATDEPTQAMMPDLLLLP